MKDRNSQHPISSSKEMGALVAAYRQSGLSLKEFARQHGIRPGRLHYWVYQKNQEAKPRSLTREPRVGRGAVFQEVKLEAGTSLLQSWAAEVSLSRGLKVRFSSTAGPEWIGAVIHALERPC